MPVPQLVCLCTITTPGMEAATPKIGFMELFVLNRESDASYLLVLRVGDGGDGGGGDSRKGSRRAAVPDGRKRSRMA